jgi:O-acetyl-ADP-ribose deacetylase (regulator of RNase III)
MIEIITGDLLDATEKYILHQTNCLSDSDAAGVARLIFNKYPHSDCYSDRVTNSKPGTIDVRGDGLNQRYVINLHGQYYPGGVGGNSDSELDGTFARQKYFYLGLLRVAKIENLESIAMPYKVGCGIAGGNWEYYLGVLKNFAKYVGDTQGASVVIYRREGDL